MTRSSEAEPDRRPSAGGSPALVDTEQMKPGNYDGTCLRPTGMCELGGSCDICWYSPDHPRFQSSRD